MFAVRGRKGCSSIRWSECWFGFTDVCAAGEGPCGYGFECMTAFIGRVRPTPAVTLRSDLPIHCKSHQTRHVVNVQLLHQAGPISVHRLWAEAQPRGNLLGAHALYQQREDLVFPAAQPIEGIALLFARLALREY